MSVVLMFIWDYIDFGGNLFCDFSGTCVLKEFSAVFLFLFLLYLYFPSALLLRQT